jgi:hypothetical protein
VSSDRDLRADPRSLDSVTRIWPGQAAELDADYGEAEGGDGSTVALGITRESTAAADSCRRAPVSATVVASCGKPAQDLGALTGGIFYCSTLGTPQSTKLKTPLCLSHNPQNPATTEEIIELSRG